MSNLKHFLLNNCQKGNGKMEKEKENSYESEFGNAEVSIHVELIGKKGKVWMVF